jgi:hypothetical protein
MASGDVTIIPAQAAGFFSFQGSIAKNSGGDLLDIPAGMLNIGGNGKGYLLAAVGGWNPYLAGNNDASFAAITLGDDIYVYAVQQASGFAKLVASKNATTPTGYTTSNSRKIGGFHVGRTRPLANRFDAAYLPLPGIVPGSVWDMGHRPKCSPEGMNEFQPGLWGSIYLLSTISGAWPSIVFGSRFNVQPVRSIVYNQLDLHRGVHAAGMREPTFEEWLMMADGAPQGVDATNDTAWAATANTGPCNTGAVQKSVSCANFVDCVGSLYENISGQFDIGNSTNAYAWDATVVNTGQDAAIPRGQVNHAAWRYAIAGGYWGDGVHAGARSLNTVASAWIANGYVGVRGVSDSL